jgi:nicotinamide riboside kinase
MPEYGREYWEKHQKNRKLTPRQLLEIAKGHIEREEAVFAQSNSYCFVDTNAVTTAMFGFYYHGAVLPRLAQLADACQRRYDVVIVCGDDIPYADTWDRSGDVARRIFQKQILADLQMRKTRFEVVTGSVEERVAAVRQILARFA